jgi:hypothetical protein
MGGVVVSVLAQRIPKHMQGLEQGEKAHNAFLYRQPVFYFREPAWVI